MIFAFTLVTHAGDATQDVAEPAAEDIALVFGHLQGLLDAVREAVAGEAKGWEHGETGNIGVDLRFPL